MDLQRQTSTTKQREKMIFISKGSFNDSSRSEQWSDPGPRTQVWAGL